MRKRRFLLAMLLVMTAGVFAGAGTLAGRNTDKKATNDAPTSANANERKVTRKQASEDQLIEGERRFHANCGRCHAAPHKFPPRMMATIVRHMRVRATITDQDMRLILAFMTQ